MGLPVHTPFRLVFPGQSRTRAVLTVMTGALAPPGHYRLRLRGSGGRFTTTTRLALTVTRASSAPFVISGSITGLQPGIPQPLDLSVRNPNPAAILIRSLTVAIQSVDAPRSTAALPCTTADFSIRQFASLYPVVVPPSSTRTLSSLAIPSAALPQILLLQRTLNQDGCQGATVTLAYGGNAVVL